MGRLTEWLSGMSLRACGVQAGDRPRRLSRSIPVGPAAARLEPVLSVVRVSKSPPGVKPSATRIHFSLTVLEIPRLFPWRFYL
jgi:hypothetical protein